MQRVMIQRERGMDGGGTTPDAALLTFAWKLAK